MNNAVVLRRSSVTLTGFKPQPIYGKLKWLSKFASDSNFHFQCSN